jgi:hypothetical protein
MAPIPKPANIRRRRNQAPSDAVLPRRTTRKPPAWPFGSPGPSEAALWGSIWRRPIATLWHDQGIEPTIVGRYVRLALVEPMTPSLAAQVGSLETALGLTPQAMVRLRLRVDDERDRPVPEPGNIEAARKRYEAAR